MRVFLFLSKNQHKHTHTYTQVHIFYVKERANGPDKLETEKKEHAGDCLDAHQNHFNFFHIEKDTPLSFFTQIWVMCQILARMYKHILYQFQVNVVKALQAFSISSMLIDPAECNKSAWDSKEAQEIYKMKAWMGELAFGERPPRKPTCPTLDYDVRKL